jgi:hypothetical protein
MKNQNRISQLTLELYHRGLATNKERRLVEKALVIDSEVRKRYEALQESDHEIRRLVNQELKRLNIPERRPAPSPRKKIAVVLILAAAVLICALIPAYFLLKNNDSNKTNAIAEETAPEIITDKETDFIDNFVKDIPDKEIAAAEEPPVILKPSEPPVKTEIVEKPRPAIVRTEPASPKEPESRVEPSGVSVATVPSPDTGPRLRGSDQQVTPAVPEEPANINIPPGLSFIFDNMFANRDLTFVIIPSRITSIGKDAFAGNPLLSVTIGANVSIEDNAIPGNFAGLYNSGGKAAGTYTRPNVNSEAWVKK